MQYNSENKITIIVLFHGGSHTLIKCEASLQKGPDVALYKSRETMS